MNAAQRRRYAMQAISPQRMAMHRAQCAVALVAASVLAFAGTATPAAAQERPMLVEYLPKTAAFAEKSLAASKSALDGIRSDPGLMALEIGRAAPDPVIQAGALSIVLPGSGETLTFDDLVVEDLDSGGHALYSPDRQSTTSITLVVMGEDVVGSFHHDGAVYGVRPLGDGLTAVYEYDATQLRGPDEEVDDFVVPDVDPKGSALLPQHAPLAAADDRRDEIDVLVAYSQDVKQDAVNVDARIALLVLHTHLTYRNSGITTRLRVVHSYETLYQPREELDRRDLGKLDDLKHLQIPDDGELDEAINLRNQYGADVVVLLYRERNDLFGRNVCGGGIAYQLTSGSNLAEWAFAVSGVGSEVCSELDARTLAHELGHVQGASHNPGEVAIPPDAYTYGHGFCNAVDNWRTVMAYDTGGRCMGTIPHISNPDVSYEGTPTGDVELRNAARLINETAFTVANYRRRIDDPADREHTLPLFVSASHQTLQGFVRIINRSERAGTVTIHATDDSGQRFGPVTLALAARETKHFNSDDLRDGAPEKGLDGRIEGGQGNFRHLELDTDLDIEPLAYSRPREEGFLAGTHDVTRSASMRWHVPIFNPGGNTGQQSWLRVVNTSGIDTEVVVRGLDDDGAAGAEVVRFDLPGNAARMLSAQALEQGSTDSAFDGRLGDGAGKWQLFVSAGRPIQVMSLLLSATGDLTNLSTVTGDRTVGGAASESGRPTHVLALFTPASDSRYETFVRIINRSESAGTVDIHAIDDDGRRVGPVSLSLDAGATRHFNSGDLEVGNLDKGFSAGVGTSTSNRWLELTSALDIDPLAYIRTPEGFLTSIHDVATETLPRSLRYHVPVFNPGSNTQQRSRLRIVNSSGTDIQVLISGLDDRGAAPPGREVTLSVPANEAGMLSAQALEQGYSASESDFEFDGSFGDGAGKWQLFVSAGHPIQVMSLLSSGDGKLTNLSTVMGDAIIRGTAGGDVLYGGDRNDVFDPLDNGTSTDLDVDRGFDTVYGSRGDDTIIYTRSGEEAYQEIDYSELNAVGVNATIDGTNNRATVDKGADGFDTIVDIAKPLVAAGFGINGTQFDDTFDLTLGEEQFANAQGRAGDDTFDVRLQHDSAWFRISYLDAPDGIDLDLDARLANDDGFGDVDTFNGDLPRGIAGSVFSDVIRGTDAEESFFGREGDDHIDGGGGIDMVHFSYVSRWASAVDVQNLEVDLDAGTATGTWNGSPFSYTLENIEGVWGGAGDDVIRGTIELFQASTGNDRIVFTNDKEYAQLNHHRLPEGGITATLDGVTGQGEVDKGASGTDTLENMSDLLDWNNGGLGLSGTDSDDVFNLTMGAEQWMQVRGRAGNDTFNVEADLDSGGLVRLDYRNSPSGVFVHLSDGKAYDDGYGDEDTINGDVWQVCGSDFADEIVGSDNDEHFFGRGSGSEGDRDKIDGGGGWDTLRFDRSCCVSIYDVEVELYANRASGVWNGQRFSYLVRNIEEVRGSDAIDSLQGDSGDNRFRAGGGDDTLRGREGNDRLQGDGGRDQFIFGPGHGDDRIDDFSNGSDTIVLMGLGVSASDVLANAESRSDGTRVWIDLTGFGGGTIDLRNFSIDDLDASDFRIVN